jgi:hypothetical protein
VSYHPHPVRREYWEIANYAQPLKLALGALGPNVRVLGYPRLRSTVLSADVATPAPSGMSENTKMLLWGGGIGIAAVATAILLRKHAR